MAAGAEKLTNGSRARGAAALHQEGSQRLWDAALITRQVTRRWHRHEVATLSLLQRVPTAPRRQPPLLGHTHRSAGSLDDTTACGNSL
ncbi:hypothetical protein PVAP13_2NG402606 [Panicum virgatum]|uniref:Uncharacterized protein n=1 Tax=Panicum virgatum TaxID=38727 RepID=A0A8T0VME7_PANVG|nr:hypothetical protein PVAP13_2NG402606 [Panicum virgatum]